MHSSDRTLLAKLGFADPDRRDGLHDLACQYLTQPEVVRKIGMSLVAPVLSGRTGNDSRYALAEMGKPSFEVHLGKGEGQYRTTIGFLDVVLPFLVERSWSGTNCKHTYQAIVVIEVKVTPVGIGDLKRQLGLYREYVVSEDNIWVYATTYPVPPIDVESLRASGIHHLLLADGFRPWVKQREEMQELIPTSDRSIVI